MVFLVLIASRLLSVLLLVFVFASVLTCRGSRLNCGLCSILPTVGERWRCAGGKSSSNHHTIAIGRECDRVRDVEQTDTVQAIGRECRTQAIGEEGKERVGGRASIRGGLLLEHSHVKL